MPRKRLTWTRYVCPKCEAKVEVSIDLKYLPTCGGREGKHRLVNMEKR